MININNLTMGFTQRTLFKDVTFSIFPKEKIGLTGPNGAGKTTLFSIILGEREPLEGTVQVQKNINIGFLPQEAKFSSTKTVMEELTEGDERIRSLMDEKRKLEDSNKAATDRYGDVLEKLDQLGIYDLEHKAEKILSGLGFKQEDFHRPILELSGGWQMRTLLAKLLTYPSDLLLLDEPTNYLDLEATLWLKDYLANYQGAFVLISHDRLFLNTVTNYTIILDGAQMTKLKGNYEIYEQQIAIQNTNLERQKKVIDKKRKQLEDFAQRFHAQPNRASAVRNKRRMIEKLEEIHLPQDRKSIGQFEFSDIPPSGYVVASLKGIDKAYGEKVIYKNLDFELIRGQKVCFVGPNGAGKSTLLKMLAQAIEPDAGVLKYGHNVEAGYFSQSRLDVLNPNRTALEEVFSSAPGGTPTLKARTLLGLFNFHGDDVFKTVKILSGGEKSRLILAKLLINPPNFMLLDEPTTHLDLDGVKALTSAFQEYSGTLCFISHDLYFINQIADNIVDVQGGEPKCYPGGLDYYLEKQGQKALGSSGKSSDQKASQSKKQKNSSGSSSKKSSGAQNYKDEKDRMKDMRAQHRQAQKRMNQIKTEVKNLEKEQKDLETESYAKARKLAESYEKRDSTIIEEYGRRLKDIQKRQREVEVKIRELNDEKEKISK